MILNLVLYKNFMVVCKKYGYLDFILVLCKENFQEVMLRNFYCQFFIKFLIDFNSVNLVLVYRYRELRLREIFLFYCFKGIF